jgi:HSP90 family molecular chaperone
MNISKIIFKQGKKTFEINKSFYYKYETKYLGKNLIYQKRYKRYYSHYETNLKDGLKPDYMNNKTVYDLLTRHTNNYSYECFNHKNELINKDFNFYKHITIKNMRLNQNIKDLSLADQLANELSMELLIK